MGGVEYQVTKVDPTDPETKGMVYQVHKVSEEVAATLGGKVYRARIIKDPTEPTVVGKVYQIVLIDDPDDPAVKGKVYNAILTGGSEAVVVGPAASPLLLPDAIANSLSYVKAFGGTEQNGTPTPDAPMDIVSNNGKLVVRDNELPVAYKRLKDITFDGDVYYVTDTYLTGADTTSFTINATENARNVLGCYTGSGSGNNVSFYLNIAGTGNYVRYKNSLYRPMIDDGGVGQDYTLSITPTGTTGFDTDVTWTEQEFTCPNKLYIGWLANATSPKFLGAFKGNITVSNRANFVPCERVSDGAIGYYDTYSNTFFENQGTGTPTTSGYDYSHYAVIADGTVETLWAHGKNLYNPATMTANKYINASGVEVSSWGDSPLNYTDFIKVQAGRYYTISVSNRVGTAANVGAFNWFSSKDLSTILATRNTYQISTNLTDYTASFQAPTGAEYLIVNFVNGEEIQIEQGSTATTYEPYYNGGQATAEMLLKVGDYQDVQSIIDGVVTRKVGVKVFDGTETGWVRGANSIYIDGLFNDAIGYSADNPAITCSHFQGFPPSTTVSSMPDLSAKLGASNQPKRMYFAYDVMTTAAQFKQYLATQYANGTPVIILYPLATATTESVAGQTLQVQAGDNTLEITQASLDNLELECQYEKEGA